MTDRDAADAAADAVMAAVEAYSWRRMSEASANDGAYEHSTLMERDRAAVRAAVEQYGCEQRMAEHVLMWEDYNYPAKHDADSHNCWLRTAALERQRGVQG